METYKSNLYADKEIGFLEMVGEIFFLLLFVWIQ